MQDFSDGYMFPFFPFAGSVMTVILVAVTVIMCLMTTRRDTRVPPGPPILPIVGSLFSVICKDPLEKFTHLRRKYGDIYAFFVGRELTVVVNGYDIISDVLVKQGALFSRRPMMPFARAVSAYTGIVASNGKSWEEQKQLARTALRQLCFRNGTEHIEENIVGEIMVLLDKLDTLQGESINLKPLLSMSVANVMNKIVLGKSFGLDDTVFYDFMEKNFCETEILPARIIFGNCFPFLLSSPIDICGVKAAVAGIEKWQKFLEKRLVDEESCNFHNDFIDIYLKAMKESKDNNLHQSFTKRMMRNTTFDLVVAGTDTTVATMNWLFLYILHDRELESRLQFEIDDVIGKDRPPSLRDRPKMPYMEATVLECMRIAHAAPLAAPHSVHQDTVYRGFRIPKDTTIIVNLHSVMMDPMIWPEPNKFNPERFLSRDHSKVIIPKYHMAFSKGPRSCIGERLAKMELFLYMTTILQKYKLLLGGKERPPLEGRLGLTYNPQPYEVRLIQR